MKRTRLIATAILAVAFLAGPGASPPTNPPGVRVEEDDGSPSMQATKLVFPAGTVTQSGSTATIATGGGEGGSGTVTDFSAGDLSPLFTTSEATTTTTPALSFSLSNAAAHKFFGNATGSTGAPSFSSITAGDLPNAAADGSTKGAASFTANDFDASSGNLSLDYVNGQKANGSQHGFLSSTDWTTFSAKLSPIGGAGDKINPLGNVSGGITCDLSLGNWQTMTLTGNVTSCSITNYSASSNIGSGILLFIKQDGTGGRTFPAPTGATGWPTIATAAGAMTIVYLATPDNGTTWYASALGSGPITSSSLTMATGKLLGRSTASSGAIEEISVGSGLSLSAGTLSASGGGSVAGSSGQVQYNGGSGFAAESGFAWDTTGKKLSITTDSWAFEAKNSGIAHGITGWDLSGTDVGLAFGVNSPSEGGGTIVGASDTSTRQALEIIGIIGATDPDNSTPAAVFRGMKKNGTSVTDLAGDDDLVEFWNNNTSVWAIDAAGNVKMPNANKRVSSQFDKTTSAALADITGLSWNVNASTTYTFEAVLFTTSGSSGGVQAAVAGTCTATSIIYEGRTFSGTSISANTRTTTKGGAVGGVTSVTAATIEIKGTITVNAAGTLTIQFAQNASNGTTSSVLVGSYARLTKY